MGLATAKIGWENLKTFAVLVWHRFDKDRGLMVAASLSYTSLLALVPLMAIGFAVLAAFPVFDNIQVQIRAFIFSNFLPEAVDAAQEYLDQFLGAARGVTAIGVIGLAVVALLLFSTVEAAMNDIFRVSKPRPIATRLLVFWAILTLGPLLLGASFSLATVFHAYTRSLGGEQIQGGLAFAGAIVPAALAIAAFTMFYMILPSRPVKFRHALLGAVVAGFAFVLLRVGFTLYIANFPTYQTLYGALAILPIFLFYMYLSWAVILLGAIITSALPEWGRRRRFGPNALTPAERLKLALTLLAQLYRCTETGGGLKRRALLQSVASVTDATVDAMLETLREERFVDITKHGRWLPARNPESTNLYHLLAALDLDVPPETLDAGGPDEDGWLLRLEKLLRRDGERRREALGVSLRSLLLEEDRSSAAGTMPSPVLIRTPR